MDIRRLTNGGSGGSGTVTSVSVATANGFSGTVANATTTPAITIIAGAITPTTSVTTPLVIESNNAITASSSAATVPITSSVSTVTNDAAGTLTITITTTNAVNRQKLVVCILDHSAVAQTISWVNTENSEVNVPTTSNGSTTLPLTVGFMYNLATTSWRCLAVA